LDSPLANQESETPAAKVSKLPLPISDSPLVIDLPDGQKIVVGKMVQGSVIEVATWRGVGRPDSRTSRLMLGMGSGNINEDSDAPAPQSAPQAPKPKGFAGFLSTIQHFVKNFNRINWSATLKALVASLTSLKIKKSKKVSTETTAQEADAGIRPAVKVSPVSEDAEIEAWLNKISEKASRDTAKGAVKKSAPSKAPAKKAASKAVVKKAAPKSTNSRGSKK
jgi:hypothetical protein